MRLRPVLRLIVPALLLCAGMLRASAQQPGSTTPLTPDPNAPVTVDFDAIFPPALEFRAPILAVMTANRALLAPTTQFTVSAYRDIPDWALVTLVPTALVRASWAGVETRASEAVEIVLRQTAPGEWNPYILGSPTFAAIASDLPASFIDVSSPLPEITTGYKFPWMSGQTWWAINGWHDGSAIDFEPALIPRYAVLASQSGRLRELCSDGYQSLLQIEHADGRSTFYLHVTLSLNVRRHLLNQIVRQGQYLGEIIGSDQFHTPCGVGFSRHLHFAVSDRSLLIEDTPLEGLAASASCCADPPEYTSTNQRIDDSRPSLLPEP